jgi:Tfp pilus assembly protein PilE
MPQALSKPPNMKVYMLFVLSIIVMQLAYAADESIGFGDSVNINVIRNNFTFNHTSNQTNKSVMIYQVINFNIDANKSQEVYLSPPPVVTTETPEDTPSQEVQLPTTTNSTSTDNKTISKEALINIVIILFFVLIIVAVGISYYFYRYFTEKKAMRKVPLDILKDLEFAERRYKENGGTDPTEILWELAKNKRDRHGSSDEGTYGFKDGSFTAQNTERSNISNDSYSKDRITNTDIPRDNTSDTRPERNNRSSVIRRLFKGKR